MKTIRHRFEIAILIFLLIFGVLPPQHEAVSAGLPPVAAPLVREGDYAVRLAYALRVVTTDNELEAETRLAEIGISPRNGWMADYPITPDIVAELQNAIAAAADSGRLMINRDDALRYLAEVSSGFGLSVLPAQGGYPSSSVQSSPDPSIIDNYYSNVGSPVVTYYPPPSAYISFYAWVPSPFWWAGWWFPGYYILHDFHHPVIFPHRTVYISNRFWDRQDRHFHRVDPLLRSHGAIHAHADIPQAKLNTLRSQPAREKGVIENMDQRPHELRRTHQPVQSNAIPAAPEVKRSGPPPRSTAIAESPKRLGENRRPDRPDVRTEVRPESHPAVRTTETHSSTGAVSGRAAGRGAVPDPGRMAGGSVGPDPGRVTGGGGERREGFRPGADRGGK